MSENKEPKLQVAQEEELKKDLGFKPVEEIDLAGTAIEKKADDFLDKLLDDSIQQSERRNAVDDMGMGTQREVTELSKMLDEPIKSLAKSGESGGPVAKSLLDLKEQVEALDPVNFDLSSPSGFFASIAKLIPFVGSKIERYFSRYMTAEAVIDRIINSLEIGKDQLKRDNITLSQDKERMRASMGKLMGAIKLGQVLDQKLQYKLDREISPEDDKHKFVKEELLFPLRQRILDLQQTLNVNQQGILTIELIIRNNRELIRGVDRALNVTVSALQIAVACAMALNHQQIVLDKITALNDTTSKLIANNAERLKTQGAEIHKKASEASLNIQDLERAFNDIKIAMDDISKFRSAALPKMANNILRMDQLNEEAFKAIQEMEKGNRAQSNLIIDLDESDYNVVN